MENKNRGGLARGIWALGFVSLFMDVSSEMIHALLPVFMVSTLGASAVMVGFIEGLGEGLALISRVFSGALSDWMRRRKLLILSAYLMATLTKPLFALAQGMGLVITARSLDRIGKGIRGAPRDALVADLSTPQQRGSAYGLRQALDSLGAFIGPLLAILFMAITADDIRTVFWLAVIPGAVAVLIIIFFIREPEVHKGHAPEAPVKRGEIRDLGRAYWMVLLVSLFFTLARFSEAFLILRAQGLGLTLYLIPTVLMTMSLVYALAAYPAGKLSDRLGRPRLLAAGLVMLVLADLLLAQASSLTPVFIGAGLWGLHMALTQGVFSAWVADSCEAHVRGTAFGLYGLISGIAVLLASLIAGWLWEQYGAPATFYTGGGFALLTLLGFAWLRILNVNAGGSVTP
jgi:MFS family permease